MAPWSNSELIAFPEARRNALARHPGVRKPQAASPRRIVACAARSLCARNH